MTKINPDTGEPYAMVECPKCHAYDGHHKPDCKGYRGMPKGSNSRRGMWDALPERKVKQGVQNSKRGKQQAKHR